MNNLNYSLVQQLILHEGLKLKPYKCSAGYWTIGVGRNLETNGLSKQEQKDILGAYGLEKEEVISLLKVRGLYEEEAMLLLNNDIIKCYDIAEFRWFRFLNAVREKVVIDMRFNLGRTGFLEFKKMIRQLELENYWNAAEEMKESKWYHQTGERAKRLVVMMATGQDYKL